VSLAREPPDPGSACRHISEALKPPREHHLAPSGRGRDGRRAGIEVVIACEVAVGRDQGESIPWTSYLCSRERRASWSCGRR
jgi:hypothetical protein